MRDKIEKKDASTLISPSIVYKQVTDYMYTVRQLEHILVQNHQNGCRKKGSPQYLLFRKLIYRMRSLQKD